VRTASIADNWFAIKNVRAPLIEPTGRHADRLVQIRTNPISGRTSRITFSRVNEKEAGSDRLPSPPPDASETARCPFCRPQVLVRTPQMISQLHPGRPDDAG
jgi:UDPglucose--hexose-1-phosphate uridylyltransferase